MSKSKSTSRPARPKDGGKRPGKKKPSILVQEKVEYIDYKDVNLLQRFMSDRSKIRSRRVTSNTTQQQREIATAVKNAREMALLPYTKRVATQRAARPPRDGEGGPGRDGRDGRDGREGREAPEAVDTVEEETTAATTTEVAVEEEES
jgi:small subunit ribosomal protein S18